MLAYAAGEHQDNRVRIGQAAAATIFLQRLHALLVNDPPEDEFLREVLQVAVDHTIPPEARALALNVAGERLVQLRENGWRSCDVL